MASARHRQRTGPFLTGQPEQTHLNLVDAIEVVFSSTDASVGGIVLYKRSLPFHPVAHRNTMQHALVFWGRLFPHNAMLLGGWGPLAPGAIQLSHLKVPPRQAGATNEMIVLLFIDEQVMQNGKTNLQDVSGDAMINRRA